MLITEGEQPEKQENYGTSTQPSTRKKEWEEKATKDIEIKGKKAVRVFSGPFVNRNKAEKAKKKLDGKYNVKSLIIYFDA